MTGAVLASVMDAGEAPVVERFGVVWNQVDAYLLKIGSMAGEVATDAMTFAAFFKTPVGGTLLQTGVAGNASSAIDLRVAGGKFAYELRSNTGSTLLSGSTAEIVADDVYKALLISRSNSSLQIYNKDTPLTPVNTIANTSGNIGVTDGTIGVCSNRIGTALYGGETGFIALIRGVALDLSVEANRRKFVNANGTPAANAAVLSTSPILFFNGDEDTWPNNLGSGGAFSFSGELTNGTTPIQA